MMTNQRSRRDGETIIIDTGNVLRPETAANKSAHYLDKLCEGLKIEISKITGTTASKKRGETESHIPPKDNSIAMNFESEEERKQCVVTVKIFPREYNKTYVREAVESAKASLRTSMLDYVILALNPYKQVSLFQVQEIFILLEKMVQKNIIKHTAISDIGVQSFIALYKWAQVKPGIQVYWSEGSVITPTLRKFIEENSVQLLKHKDPTVMYADCSLAKPLINIEHLMGTRYNMEWMARLDVSDSSTGDLKRRGYVVKLTH